MEGRVAVSAIWNFCGRLISVAERKGGRWRALLKRRRSYRDKTIIWGTDGEAKEMFPSIGTQNAKQQ